MDDDAYIRLDAAAALLGLSPRQTRRYAEGDQRRLRTRIVRRQTLFHQGDVEALARDFAAAKAPPVKPPRPPQPQFPTPDATDDQVDPLTVGELISLQDAAEYANLTKDTLHNYAKRGRLKAKRLGPIWVTTRAAIDQYLSSRRPKFEPNSSSIDLDN